VVPEPISVLMNLACKRCMVGVTFFWMCTELSLGYSVVVDLTRGGGVVTKRSIAI
jgi:hypothetical protein